MNKQIENNRGRPKGSPNKSTAAVRDAMALFAEGNVHKLEEWITDVAEGADGRQADPAKAADLFLKAIEYHIPKLARTEVTGENNGPVEMKITWMK